MDIVQFRCARARFGRFAACLVGLSVSLFSLTVTGAPAQAEALAPQALSIHLPPIDQLQPAVAQNVRCHIMPVRKSPGQLGYGLPVSRPDCDRQSNFPARPSGESCPFGGCGLMQYHGGPVVTATQQTFIYLNCLASCWGNPAGFVSDLFSSTFIHVMDQYMEPSVLRTSGRYTTNPTALSVSQTEPHALTDEQLQTIIQTAIQQAFPNGGGGGYNVMYSILLPSGQDLCFTGGGECYCPDNNCGGGSWAFCAYHSSFDGVDARGAGIHIIYQAMPYQNVSSNEGSCQVNGGPKGVLADSTNNVFSHELNETISDPDGDAWWRDSDGNEIGDICNFQEQNPIYLHGNAYSIQQEYSNAALDCVGFVDVLATTHDFNADMNGDIAWRDTTGNLAVWLMNGSSALSAALIGTVAPSWSIVGQRDFDGDGNADLLWFSSGNLAIWFMNGTSVASTASLGNVGGTWAVAGTGDFNGDGEGDILWQDGSGNVAMWLMNGAQVTAATSLGNLAGWSVVGTGDFNGDGNTDILWRSPGGNLAIWMMNGTTVSSVASLGNVGGTWSVVGTGDFNGDGKSDVLWRDAGGNVAIWLMNGAAVAANAALGNVSSWTVAQTGDFDSNGKSDILWYNGGNLAVWFMNGTTVSSVAGLGSVPTVWTVQGANAD